MAMYDDLTRRKQLFLKAVKNKASSISLRQLEKMHQISHSTALRLRQGVTRPESRAGRKPLLPPEVEQQLVLSLLNCAKQACSVRLNQLPTIIAQLAQKYDVLDHVVCTRAAIWSSFQRHPELSKRLPSKSNQARLTHWNAISVARWVAMVEPLAKQFTPEQTWNCDDTGWDLETIKGKASRSQERHRPDFHGLRNLPLPLSFPSECKLWVRQAKLRR